MLCRILGDSLTSWPNPEADKLLRTFIILCVCTVSLGVLNAKQRIGKKPNIILVFTDDHGYADLGCQGIVDDIRTPHIDSLARSGVRMESGYVTAPQCVPSRGGLLTGRYQNRFGLESNKESLSGFNQQLTIADRLKSHGYATGMAGKWHLGPREEIVRHGFDDVFYKNSNRPGWSNFDLTGEDRPAGPEESSLYHIDACSDAACAFIKRHHDRPFFFYCAYRAPHVPLDATREYLDRFPGEMPKRRRQALAMISAIDDGIGKMLATLARFDLRNDTLIFLIGDNGAPLKMHKIDAPGGGPGWDGSLNDPLNGEKGMLTEGGIRVPFVMSWPNGIKSGLVYHYPVISLDVAATSLALAGAPPATEHDGVNLIPIVNRNLPAHRQLYWRWISQSAIREGKWKYLQAGSSRYLFDLENDKEETSNLIANHENLADRLQRDLESWASRLQPPGIESKTNNWNVQYDHYLEGKPAPLPSQRVQASQQNTSDNVGGWVARGCKISVDERALNIESPKSERPFLACTGLSIPENATVVVRLKNENSGRLGIAWRTAGDKSFDKNKVAWVPVVRSTDITPHRIKISARDKVIHLRLLLPGGNTAIESIHIEGVDGQVLKRWAFQS